MPAPFTLTCPPLEQIKGLADKYQVSVMVDNSAGFGYEKITPFADLVAISLSKYPAGDSGSLVALSWAVKDGKSLWKWHVAL